MCKGVKNIYNVLYNYDYKYILKNDELVMIIKLLIIINYFLIKLFG